MMHIEDYAVDFKVLPSKLKSLSSESIKASYLS